MSLPNLVGQGLGQYEILELLGIGGMGAVYRAQQLRLKRPVALKVLSPALATQKGYIERFIREAETAASLEHNHIVPIYDFGTDQNWPYIVMRLLTGGTLADRLQHSLDHGEPLPSLTEIASLLHQLGAALDYAHSLGVLHRDIKPSNIMFDDRGNAYIVDFGIAKLLEGSASFTASGLSMGTPAYMSPEQWRNEPLTPATDQYAVGIIAYQLLSGAAPFKATTPYGYMHLHLHEMPAPPHLLDEHIPADAGPILERAIAKHPAARYASVTDFADEFQASLENTQDARTGFFTKKIPRRRAGGGPGSSGAPYPSGKNKRVRQWQKPLVALGAVGAGALGIVGAAAVLSQSNAIIPPATPSPTIPIVWTVPPAQTQPFVPPVPTVTPSITDTPPPPFTATGVPTSPAPPSLSATAMNSMPSANTLTMTLSLTAAATSTPSRSPTATPSPSPTATLSATSSPTLTPSLTHTASATSTLTPSPSATLTPALSAADTPAPTVTPSPTRALTSTPSAASFPTATPRPSSTPTRIAPQPIPLPAPSLTSTPTRIAPQPIPLPAPSLTSTPTRIAPPPIPLLAPSLTSTPTQTPCQLADVNGDGEIDILDIKIIAVSYGARTENQDVDATLDFNRNGVIDILDVRRVAGQYGSVCP